MSPKKKTGEIGATRITSEQDGITSAEIVHTELPTTKEELERFFADIFVAEFNRSLPLGHGTEIQGFSQNDTSDLDFSIKCPVASFLELAEINPRSEPFGRRAFTTGKFNVHEYATWIFNRIIRKKSRSYGTVAEQTLLLLYVTHWQFLPSQRVTECIQSWSTINEPKFKAVFVLRTDGTELRHLEKILPYYGQNLPAPNAYKGFHLTNLPPGHHTWTVQTEP